MIEIDFFFQKSIMILTKERLQKSTQMIDKKMKQCDNDNHSRCSAEHPYKYLLMVTMMHADFFVFKLL